MKTLSDKEYFSEDDEYCYLREDVKQTMDKIKAEIKELRDEYYTGSPGQSAYKKVLEIIDKHLGKKLK